MHHSDAKATFGADDAIKLASNESAFPPHPAVVEAVARAAAESNRYPDQHARDAAAPDRRALRHRPRARRRRQRLLRDPARRRRGAVRAGGRARLRVARVLDVPAPRGALGRARDPRRARRRIRPRPRRDPRRDHRRDPARHRLQPQQPDRHLPAGGADRRLRRAGPRARDRDPRRGLHRVPGRRRPRGDASTCCATTPTSSACGRSASATGSPGCGSATRSARRRSGPPWTPCASRSASTGSPRPPRPRRSCTRTTSCGASSARSPSGCGSRRSCTSSGLATAETQANFSWVALGDRDEAEVVESLGRSGVIVRPGDGLGGPGHIRVTHGTRAENEAFLEALRSAL